MHLQTRAHLHARTAGSLRLVLAAISSTDAVTWGDPFAYEAEDFAKSILGIYLILFASNLASVARRPPAI